MAIYHIAYPADWEQAESDGAYTRSTKGRSLAEQGFIHAGDLPQVAPVANRVYAEDTGLLVLVIDPDLLTSELRYEAVPGYDAPFPHIYGPINPDAVTHVLPLERGEDGTYRFDG
jgi:uncharacterized protein (DUF952 family)